MAVTFAGSAARKPAGRRKRPSAAGGKKPAAPAVRQPPLESTAVEARTPSSIQAKLQVGSTEDPLEKEADRTASTVMRMPEPVEEPETSGKDDEEVVRRSADGGGPTVEAGPHTESVLAGRRGHGSALDAGTRGFMESRFRHDFSSVRVHDSAEAGAAARELEARAFTQGNDIYFASGEYQPGTSEGRHLIAHELAHVVQQSSAVGRAPIRRQDQTEPGAGTDSSSDAPVLENPTEYLPSNAERIGRIEKAPTKGKVGTIHLPALKVPTVSGVPKGASTNSLAPGKPGEGKNPIVAGAPYEFLGGTERGNTTARQLWLREAGRQLRGGLEGALRSKIQSAGGRAEIENRAGSEVAYLRLNRSDSPFIIAGTPAELAANEIILLPVWNRSKHTQFYDVDHAHELQLGGLDGWENFWLWDVEANQSSGRNIYRSLRGQVKGLVDQAKNDGFWVAERGGTSPPTINEVRQQWRVLFDETADLSVSGKPREYWTRNEIRDGEHLSHLKVMSQEEVEREGLGDGQSPRYLNIFPSAMGGFRRKLRLEGGVPQLPTGEGAESFYKGFELTAIEYDNPATIEEGRRVGVLHGTAFRHKTRKGKEFEPAPLDLDIMQSRRLGFGGYVDKSLLSQKLRNLTVKPLSPVTVDDAGLSDDGALFIQGRITATKAIFNGLEIPISVYGEQIRVDFPIPTESLSLGPVQVTEAAIRIFAGEEGFALGGILGIEVEHLGSGRLEAEGLNLHGQFDFDFDVLDPAEIQIDYVDDQLSASATLGVQEGAIPGVESAVIEVAIGPEGPAVSGTMVLSIPPLAGTELGVSWDPEAGLRIAAENIPLPVSAIPGIEGATASIRVAQDPETGAFTVSGGGSAAFGMPGVTGNLAVDVDGPLVTISGDGALQRGLMSGAVHLTVTNRPVDEEGQPVEGEPLETLTASGSGEATLQFGPLLRGTVGLTVKPDGHLELMGGIALPPVVEVFEKREWEKTLFEPPTLDIPIVGVAVAGQVIGIALSIGGSLKFEASIGPGEIRDAQLNVKFDPEAPESAEISGGAAFVVPAQAGLILAIHGGLTAGIPVVKAEAGVEVSGELGVGAEARADVQIEWTPATGLELQAEAGISAQPKFTFRIVGYVKVGADLYIAEFDLYEKRWDLASFEYGPDLQFGVTLPVRWTEREGLDFNLDDIVITRPDIDIEQLATDLFHQIS